MKTLITAMISMGYKILDRIRNALETKNVANRQKYPPPRPNTPPVA